MVYFFIALVLFTPININQADTLSIDSQATVVDTVPDNEVSQETLLAYQEVLEKTNQQLSLWWNPYGVMVAGLGVLFTILTIIAAAIIFFQGRAAKQLLNNSIERHSKILNEYIDQKNKEMKSLIDKYSEEIEKLKVNAPESDDPDDYLRKLNELEKSIEKLSKQEVSRYSSKDAFVELDFPGSEGQFVNVPLGNLMHECSKCGHIYNLPRSTALTHAKCPECGHIASVFTL